MKTTKAMPGHLPLRAGASVLLAPRVCGELKLGAGTVNVGETPLREGEAIRLWGGEEVRLANPGASGTALYSWNVCSVQPTLRNRFMRWVRRSAGPVAG